MRYNLLKDLPGLKAGEYELTACYGDYEDDTIYCAFFHTDKEYEISKEWLEDKDFFKKIEDKPKSIHDLKKGDKCYCIYNYEVSSYIYQDTDHDKLLVKVGDVFITEESAEKALQKRIARATIEKWKYLNDSIKEKIDANLMKQTVRWCIGWGEEEDLLIMDSYHGVCYSEIYFSSPETATKALKELEPQYKILFDID